MRIGRLVGSGLVLLALGACGAEEENKSALSLATAPRARLAAEHTSQLAEAPASPAPAGGTPPAAATPAPGLARKIIYKADLALIVEDFTKSEPEVHRLVAASGGYIAELTIAGSPGSQRSGTWKVRIPVDRFEIFVRQVAALGELEKNQRTSDDVSEQYYDLEARIKNKRVEEERLLKLLAEATGKLEEILKVEVEVSRVQGEIEQLQGRLRVLQELTSLTTVSISLHERTDYNPAPPIQPNFATTVSRTFADSTQQLVAVGKALILTVVAVAPWVPVILVAVVALLSFWRLLRRRMHLVSTSPG
jgi:hypothetical protein